jgi:hypothetical protein
LDREVSEALSVISIFLGKLSCNSLPAHYSPSDLQRAQHIIGATGYFFNFAGVIEPASDSSHARISNPVHDLQAPACASQGNIILTRVGALFMGLEILPCIFTLSHSRPVQHYRRMFMLHMFSGEIDPSSNHLTLLTIIKRQLFPYFHILQLAISSVNTSLLSSLLFTAYCLCSTSRMGSNVTQDFPFKVDPQ